MSSAAGPERTECRAFGIVPNQNVQPLATVLRGLCMHVRAIEVQEMVLTVPLMGGTTSTQLRISRSIQGTKGKAAAATPQQDVRWLVQHEGLPMRGPAVAGIPAAVRELTDSSCTTAATPEFFIGLGARHDYTIEKKGNEYICMHDGFELQVDVIATTLTLPAPQRSVQQNNKYVMDVRTRVRDGMHLAAAQAIGSFASKLAPLLTLQAAAVPVG